MSRLSMQERSASTQAHMENAIRLTDRIRSTSRKSMELEKLTAELNFLQDRLRALENKAMEVEKLEIAMDTLRRNLENSQQEVRDTERALRTTRKDLENQGRRVQDLEKQISGYEYNNTDLKLQVREELLRNAKLEQKLEDIDEYRTKCVEQEELINQLRKETHEKEMVAQHARKCLREEKDKNKSQDENVMHTNSFRSRYELAESEIDTLKRLITAKDKYLIQKSQTLENAKNFLNGWETGGAFKEQLLQILNDGNTSHKYQNNNAHSSKRTKHVQEDRLSTQQNYSSMNGYHRGSSPQPKHYNERSKTPDFLRSLLDNDDRGSDVSEISLTGGKTQLKKNSPSYTGSFADFRQMTESPSLNSTMESENGSNQRGRSPRVRRAQSAHEHGTSTPILEKRGRWAHRPERCKSTDSVRNNKEENEENIEDYEDRLTSCVAIDRKVIVNLSRKSDRRLYFAPAKVMYLGKLRGARDDQQIYLGIELDDALGNTDGVFKGKRYFRGKPRHGKFVLLTSLISVLDQQTGKFRKVEDILEDNANQKSRQSLPKSRSQRPSRS